MNLFVESPSDTEDVSAVHDFHGSADNPSLNGTLRHQDLDLALCQRAQAKVDKYREGYAALRSLRFHSPPLCRVAVFFIQTNVSLFACFSASVGLHARLGTGIGGRPFPFAATGTEAPLFYRYTLTSFAQGAGTNKNKFCQPGRSEVVVAGV